MIGLDVKWQGMGEGSLGLSENMVAVTVTMAMALVLVLGVDVSVIRGASGSLIGGPDRLMNSGNGAEYL